MMNIKEFSKYILLFILSQMNFLLLPIYTRNLSASAYGTLELSFATLNTLAIFFSFGLHQYIGIKFFKVKDKALMITKFSYYYMILSIPLITISLIIGYFYGYKFEFSFLHVCIIVISAFVINFRYLLLSVFNMSYKTNIYLKYIILNMFVILGLTFSLFYFGFSVQSILLIFLIANLIFLIYPYSQKERIKSYLTDISFDTKELKSILKISIPLIMIGFLNNGLNIEDRFFLSSMIDNEQVGIYSLSSKMSNALFILLSFMIGNLYMRSIYKKLGENKNRVYELYIKNIKLVGILIFLFAIIFIVYYFFLLNFSDIFIKIYSDDYYSLTKYLLFSFYLQTMFTFFSFIILFLEKVGVQAMIYTVALIINALVNYLLIPKYGTFGAVYATIFTNIYLFIAFIFVSYNIVKKYKVQNAKE